MAATSSTPDSTAADSSPAVTPETSAPAATEPSPAAAANSTPDTAAPPAPPTGPDTSGFYRLQDKALQFAPNEVHAPDYSLSRLDRERLPLPHDGWQWFDTAEAAHAHHGLELPKPEAQVQSQQQRPGQPPPPPRKESARPERGSQN
jgi:hypothetical protein